MVGGGGRARERLHRGDEPGAQQLSGQHGTHSDSGAAIVDFVLIGALLTLVFVGVVQLGVLLHVRNTLVDCAAEGARYGAFADRTPEQGAQRTRDLITMSLSPRYARDVRAGRVDMAGIRTVEVTVVAPLPVIGLLGPSSVLTVTGHGMQEPP